MTQCNFTRADERCERDAVRGWTMCPSHRSAGRASHGGKREGAGRKPSPNGSKIVSYTLSADAIETIARWQAEHNCKSASEALRQIIERCAS